MTFGSGFFFKTTTQLPRSTWYPSPINAISLTWTSLKINHNIAIVYMLQDSFCWEYTFCNLTTHSLSCNSIPTHILRHQKAFINSFAVFNGATFFCVLFPIIEHVDIHLNFNCRRIMEYMCRYLCSNLYAIFSSIYNLIKS